MRAYSGLVIAILILALPAAAQQDASAPATTPPAAGPPLADPALQAFVEQQRDDLGRRCDLRAVFPSGQLRYLACGDAGVWIVRIDAKGRLWVVERRELEGSAVGLFARDGYLWVELARVQALRFAATGKLESSPQPTRIAPASPVAEATSEPAPRTSPPPQPAAPQRQTAMPKVAARAQPPAKVVSGEPGFVIVALGTDDGVDNGDHVAFYENVHDDIGGDQIAVRHRQLAVGKVVSVARTRTRIALGLDERVPVGAFAELTGAPLTASSLAPPRAAGLWDIGFVARPFMVIDNLGAGAFIDARAGYRSEGGLHLEALLEPFAVASAHQGAATPFAALGSAGYDARLFEVGFGLGGQTLYQPSFDLSPGTGLTFAQRVRLGSRDGLMIEAWSYVALFHSEFKFSSLRVQGQIPLSDTAWLLLAGGGGSLGLGYGEVGLRLLLVGNGDRGSFFLRTVIGGLNVFKSWPCLTSQAPVTTGPIGPVGQNCRSNLDYSGPMIGAGGEWRL